MGAFGVHNPTGFEPESIPFVRQGTTMGGPQEDAFELEVLPLNYPLETDPHRMAAHHGIATCYGFEIQREDYLADGGAVCVEMG